MSLSDKVLALVDSLDDFRAKLVAKIESKRPSAILTANAETVENKSAATLSAEITAIYQDHFADTDNPHNLTANDIGGLTAAEVDGIAEDYLTNKANTLDFIGHPSIAGLPLANTVAAVSTPLRYCKLEKQPGDVLVANMLNGDTTFDKQILTQVKCPIANSGDALRPLAYATQQPVNHTYLGFGDGFVLQRNTSLLNTASNGFITRTTDAPFPNSKMALVIPATFQGALGGGFNYKSDLVYYGFNNRIGCFYANSATSNYNTEEYIFSGITDVKTHEDVVAGNSTTSSSTFSNNLGSAAFRSGIEDYCTFTGTTPVVNAFTYDDSHVRRDLLCYETDTHIKITVFTRAAFLFGSYQPELITFYMREEYERLKTSTNIGFTKTYTSPKVSIDYPNAIFSGLVVYDDTNGLAPYMVLENTVACRTAFYRGKYFLYGYTYSVEGTQIGGKFWKVLLSGTGYDFSVAKETLFEGSWESLALLGNAAYLGATANEVTYRIGRSVHGKAAVLQLTPDVTTFNAMPPYANATLVQNIPYTSSSTIRPLLQPGSGYKIIGYSDDSAITTFTANRFLWGVVGLDDTVGNSVLTPGDSYGNDTTFPKALQNDLAAQCKALITTVVNYDDIVLDIIIPPDSALPAFAIAYPYFLPGNPQLAGQREMNVIIFSFITNTRVGNITSFSNLTRITSNGRPMSKGLSLNNELAKLWNNNTLINPVMIHCYNKSTTPKYRMSFDIVPVFCLSREGTVKTALQTGMRFSFLLTAGVPTSVLGSFDYTTDDCYAATRPLAEAKLTATRLLANYNERGDIGYRYTDNLDSASITTLKYIGPLTEFSNIFSLQGQMPYGLDRYAGIWKAADYFTGYALNTMATQFNTLGIASVTFKILFSINTAGSSPTPNVTFVQPANDTANRTAQNVLLATVSRTYNSFTYDDGNHPRVGISSYLVSPTPAHRSIMTVPNQNV